jgi:protein phosphatase 1H
MRFFEMDALIEYENKHFDGVDGGCTAVVCLFILNKVYIANAGDSRAILCRRNTEALALSNDFTPETERTRIRKLAAQNPELLGGEFTSNEYLRRPVKRDIGSKILYRAAHMTGWSYKTAEQEDLKFPVVFGQGKRSRVLATIGVTRGFGDHELSAHSTSARIKPFLSSQPEVKIINIEEMTINEDDVIVMGTDGLWDVTANDTVATIVFSTVDQFPSGDPIRFKYRYASAAQDLVMHARGKFSEKRNWRMNDGSAATIDDISVVVIPLWAYKMEIMENNPIRVSGSEVRSKQIPNTTVPHVASASNGESVNTATLQNGLSLDHEMNPVQPLTDIKNNNASNQELGNQQEQDISLVEEGPRR